MDQQKEISKTNSYNINNPIDQINLQTNQAYAFLNNKLPNLAPELKQLMLKHEDAIATIRKINQAFNNFLPRARKLSTIKKASKASPLSNIIKAEGKQGVQKLKEIYKLVDKNSLEQKQNFNTLYNTLFNLSKMISKNEQEQLEKYRQIQAVNIKIIQFYNQLNNYSKVK